MNRTELVRAIAKESKISQEKVTIVLDAFIKNVIETLSDYDRVQISGLGSFDVKKRRAKKGYNPSTGEHIIIPETYVIVFRPGKALREAMYD